MKRRNAEIPKLRRPVKRNKITEGMYGSTLLYLKFLVLWVLVILADFILEFRFEFLWPFYLLLRSVYDSFKYQGLAFSMFFVFVALTSDMLCFFFIPAHWMFFAASTYVWVQYVWHTDKGVCAPTILLWILFVYLEAAVRLRDVKHMPGYLDLCRPFAAHCIGYPVVTLGFGLKSYVGYRIRQRKQREVAKENEFYMQLMQQALPVDLNMSNSMNSVNSNPEKSSHMGNSTSSSATTNNSTAIHAANVHHSQIQQHHQPQQQQQEPTAVIQRRNQQNHEKNSNSISNTTLISSGNNCVTTPHHKSFRQQKVAHVNGNAVGAGIEDAPPVAQETNDSRSSRRREKRDQDKERDRESEYLMQKLEGEARRLRSDLQSSRASEQELRLQVAALTTSEKVSKGELSTMQREIEDLQQRLQSAVGSKNSDKQTIGNLERRVADERRARCSVESQLNQERKSRKQQEQVRSAGECTDACRARRRDADAELAECRAAKRWSDERCAAAERENAQLVDQLRDREMLMSALSAMQEKNAHLENSLSAETRIKLDLFSALGEAKRQLEIRESSVRSKEAEIEELKSKIAQVLAVMPTDHFTSGPSAHNSRVRLTEPSPTTPTPPPGSTLDPNATAYTPKCSSEA